MSVVVIGGVNIDIGGISRAPLVPHDSNPGKARISLGGVGRNIAHNLRLLNVPVTFLTALGDDAFADRIKESCTALGIDLSHARILPGRNSSTYLYIGGPDGDMHLAVSDMEICEEIDPAYIEQNLELLEKADAIVIDANLPEETIEYICSHTDRPIFADPVSTVKAGKLKKSMGRIFAMKPNRIEAEILSGIRITDEGSLCQAAEAILRAGVKRVFISLGKDGVLAGERGSEEEAAHLVRVQAVPAKVRNATGAGDAFMAGLVWAHLHGLGLEDSAKAAARAAAVAVEGPETINPDLGEDTIQ
ncbi:MAG: carbohydrate kinase family protein [Firmicutes bacterium]|nr:carbohydrate kinase family protein [Bacillota bacterium]